MRIQFTPTYIALKHAMTCAGCRNGNALDFDFSMACQPIVDIETGLPFAYEALVRGPDEQPAGWVLSQVTDANRYAFDQAYRVKAISKAVEAGTLMTLPNSPSTFCPMQCILQKPAFS